MVRSHSVLVWTHYPAKKSLVVVSGEWVVSGNLMLAQVQVFSLYSLDLLDLTRDLTWTWT